MTAEDRFSIPEEEWTVLPAWSGQLARLLLLVAAWLLFRWTAEPSLGVVVACSQFGANYALTGLWLRRVDPIRRRGRTVSWFCFAHAFWNVTLASFLTVLVAIFALVVMNLQGPAAQGPNDPAKIGAVTAIVGVLCAGVVALLSVLAVLLAWSRNVLVWIDPSLHRFRRSRIWPPQPTGKNQVGWFVVATTIVAVLLPFGVLGISLLQALEGIIANARLVEIACVGVWLFALAMTAVVSLRIMIRISAKTPEECWGTTEPDPASALPANSAHEISLS